MTFYFLTLFPEIVETYLSQSILGRAREDDLYKVIIKNIRDYSLDKHKRTDDYPYGGGAGMLMTPQPIADAIKSIPNWKDCRIIFPSPSGKVFKQKNAKELSEEEKDIIFICGHYEGIDQRIIDLYVDDEYTIGDYILTGGELPALVMADSILRNVPGVLGNYNSISDESFSNTLLEYPQYTRPFAFEGLEVPEILLSGHHSNIESWREQESIKKTMANRPELLEQKQTNHSERGENEREN